MNNPEQEEIDKERVLCFGQYYDEYMNPCECGASGNCSYCVECQREDPNF